MTDLAQLARRIDWSCPTCGREVGTDSTRFTCDNCGYSREPATHIEMLYLRMVNEV